VRAVVVAVDVAADASSGVVECLVFESQAFIESWFGKLKEREVWLNGVAR
jgi:hypothetical protein